MVYINDVTSKIIIVNSIIDNDIYISTEKISEYEYIAYDCCGDVTDNGNITLCDGFRFKNIQKTVE